MQLYIHVPFCVKKCHYCAFYSLPAASLKILENFCPKLEQIKTSVNIYEGIEEVIPQKTQNVQSLSSFLTGKKQEKSPQIILDETKPSLSLADAFLSKEQADCLRAKFGISEFSPQKIQAKKAKRLKLPKEFCFNFLEEHPLKQSPEFHLWKTTLLKELSILAQYYKDKPITSIFFGGGTPSFIPIKDMEDILFFIIGNFSVLEDCEISLEANPDSISNIKAVAYRKMGFNRVSLGVQSLNDKYLKILGRPHTSHDAQKAYHALRSAGFPNISLDFIWAIPEQRLRTWLDDLREAINLSPEHISAYGLSIEEGSYFDLLDKEGKLKLAGEQEQAQMYKTASSMLEEAGYMQYEISNYAKMGYQCQHNLGYWLGNDYLGVGPSAASTVGTARRTHSTNLEDWAVDISTCFANDINAQVHNEKYTGAHNYTTEYLSKTEQICELVMLRLRTTKGLNVEEYNELSQRNFLREHKNLLHLLDKNNLMRIKNGYVYFTRNGMLVSNSILEHFFRNIKENQAKLALEQD